MCKDTIPLKQQEENRQKLKELFHSSERLHIVDATYNILNKRINKRLHDFH